MVPVLLDQNGKVNEPVSKDFLGMLDSGSFVESSSEDFEFSADTFGSLRVSAYQCMATVREARERVLRQRNEALLGLRRLALEKTYNAKTRRAKGRLENAKDERIIRMHQGEIRNLNQRLDRALAELESLKQVSVSYEPVAYGLVQLISANDAIPSASTIEAE